MDAIRRSWTGYGTGLVEVLVGHQDRQLVTVLQFLDLFDRALDEDRRQADRGLVDHKMRGADISARANAASAARRRWGPGELAPPFPEGAGLSGETQA